MWQELRAPNMMGERGIAVRNFEIRLLLARKYGEILYELEFDMVWPIWSILLPYNDLRAYHMYDTAVLIVKIGSNMAWFVLFNQF